MYTYIDIKAGRQTNRLRDEQTDIETDRQTGRQTDRQTDRQRKINTDNSKGMQR